MSKSRDVRTLLIKEEVTYGTDPVPAAATDALLVEDAALSFEPSFAARSPLKNTGGALPKPYAGMLVGLSFAAEIKGAGSGNGDTPPKIGRVLQACGFKETIDATPGSESVVYTPSSDQAGHKHYTIYVNIDGILYKVVGLRGTGSIDAPAGEILKVQAQLSGKLLALSDAALPDPTYETLLPAPLVGAAAMLGGSAVNIGKFSLDFARQVNKPRDISDADGYGEIFLSPKREMTGTIDPDTVALATRNDLTQLKANTLLAFTTGWIGGATPNQRFKITVPKMQLTGQNPDAERDGLWSQELTYMATENAGDDECEIRFGN